MIKFLTYCSFIMDSWSEYYSSIYIFQVIFTTVYETKGNGGAIYINTQKNLLIESYKFIQCHANGEGGAIYFRDENGKCYLKMICSTNSFINNLNGLQYSECLLSVKESISKYVCRTFNMIGNRCNMLRRSDNDILLI